MSDLAVPSWRPRQEKQGISVRMLAVAGALLGVVALAGVVAWGLSRMGPHPVPVIEADVRPLKIRPENPGGMVVPNQDQYLLEAPAQRREAERRSTAGGKLGAGPEAPQFDLLQRQAAPPPTVTPVAPAPAAPPAPAMPPSIVPLAPPVAAPLAVPAPIAAPRPGPVANGRAMIQLGALTTEEAARAEWDRVAKRVPELAGFQPRITKLEREGQAPLWRLRAGGLADAAAARTLCDAIRTKGAACVPVGG